jgi:hypothetical protein
MKVVRTAHVALVIALAAFFLGGCGAMADRSPASYPQSPHKTRRLEQAAEADRDSDGVTDQGDVAPAAAPGPMGGEEAGSASTGGAMSAKAPPPPPGPPGQPPTEPRPEPPSDGPRAGGTEAPHDTSMLIYTARVTMAVYQVDQGLVAVEKIARDNGGYLALKKDRAITVRVPRNRFEPALAAIDKVGDVLHRDVQAQDVTDEFVDAEIRIKNARAMQVRLKTLLEKANVKEALEIEKEMRRVTEELELLEGKLKLLKDKIAYSTITVVFEARGSAIQTTRIKLPFPWLSQLGLPTLLHLSEDR